MNQRLDDFINNGGLKNYARARNFDFVDHHDNVSQLSPYIRHRVITEGDVIKTALSKYPYSTIEKFIQEVFWRTYWKGWLEHRPDVWQWYCDDLKTLDKTEDYDLAINAQTNIDCFNHWVTELKNTGYLHNHARMWFASIWIFTLDLPWQLGADFFMQYLKDGDAASNTLSWRWVAGLQTKGKTYLARASNIEKFTDDHFSPNNISDDAEPKTENKEFQLPVMPQLNFKIPEGRCGLLITEEDISAEKYIAHDFVCKAAINLTHIKSPNGVSQNIIDQTNKFMDRFDIINNIDDWKLENNLDFIVTAYCPVGHVRDFLSGRDDVIFIARQYDKTCWPYATKGFFKFKEQIPQLIGELNLG